MWSDYSHVKLLGAIENSLLVRVELIFYFSFCSTRQHLLRASLNL